MRVETLLSESAPQPKPSPVHLLLDAFNTSSEDENSEHVGLWNSLKTAATEASSKSSAAGAQEGPQFGRVFVDETIQLLSSISPDSIVMSPVLEIASPVPRRSSPFSKIFDRSKDKAANGNGNGLMTPTSPVAPPIVSDWAQFSTSGFGEANTATPLAATLLDTDKDVEITESLVTPKSSKRWGRSRSRQRSADSPSETCTKEPAIISTKLASVHMTQVDEAFIDFWSDAITDPITENWPSFVICGLKPLPSAEAVNWLIVEQTYVRQQRAQPRATSPERRGRTSPRPSFRSDISGTFAATRKRFSLFSGGSKTSLIGKKAILGKSPKIGELGEILPEEEEKAEDQTVRAREGNGLGFAAGTAAEAVQPCASPPPSLGPAPQEDAVEEPMQAVEEEAIPPAPINVILGGDTPGPQVALDTSEPAALAAASDAPAPDESAPQATVEEPISQPAVGGPEVPEPASDVEEEPIVETPEVSSPDDTLPAVPVVDASPDLPVTLVEQISIVEETLAEDSTAEVEDAVTSAVTEPAQPGVPDEVPTHGAVISNESPSSADAQVDVDVPEEHPPN